MTFPFGTLYLFSGGKQTRCERFTEWKSRLPGIQPGIDSCLEPLRQAAKLARLNPGGADSDKLVPTAAEIGGS